MAHVAADDASHVGTFWSNWLRTGLPCGVAVFAVSIGYFVANDVIAPKGGSLEAVAAALGQSDGGSYIQGGRALLDSNIFAVENRWLVNLWPPGMFVHFAALIEISSLGVALPVVVAVTMATLWSVVLGLWYVEIRTRGNQDSSPPWWSLLCCSVTRIAGGSSVRDSSSVRA